MQSTTCRRRGIDNLRSLEVVCRSTFVNFSGPGTCGRGDVHVGVHLHNRRSRCLAHPALRLPVSRVPCICVCGWAPTGCVLRSAQGTCWHCAHRNGVRTAGLIIETSLVEWGERRTSGTECVPRLGHHLHALESCGRVVIGARAGTDIVTRRDDGHGWGERPPRTTPCALGGDVRPALADWRIPLANGDDHQARPRRGWGEYVQGGSEGESDVYPDGSDKRSSRSMGGGGSSFTVRFVPHDLPLTDDFSTLASGQSENIRRIWT